MVSLNFMKRIYITKLLNKQKELGDTIKIINGNTTIDERIETYNKFNSGEYTNISITESLVLSGGVRYEKNNDEIEIVFLDDISEDKKKYVLSRMNIN